MISANSFSHITWSTDCWNCCSSWTNARCSNVQAECRWYWRLCVWSACWRVVLAVGQDSDVAEAKWRHSSSNNTCRTCRRTRWAPAVRPRAASAGPTADLTTSSSTTIQTSCSRTDEAPTTTALCLGWAADCSRVVDVDTTDIWWRRTMTFAPLTHCVRYL